MNHTSDDRPRTGLQEPTLSIVIPAYNEAKRIGPTLDELYQVCGQDGRLLEVIVVDDGSTDDTAAVASAHLEMFDSASVIRNAPNRGKGHAVRSGMLAAHGDLRLFMDADGSTALGEIGRFLDEATHRSGEFVLIGSIALPEADVAPQVWYRQLAGRAANWLIRLLVLPGIRDSQRGFKLFTAEVSDYVFSRCTIDGWLFDVEALALARAVGAEVEEVPVRWEHRKDSRVTGWSYVQTLVDLVRIRIRLWTGRYGLD